MDRPTWQRAYGLATIFEGLRAFPFIAGGSPDEGSVFFSWLDDASIKERTDETIEAMSRWLS